MRFKISKLAMPLIVLAASSLTWAQDTSAPPQTSDNADATATSNVTAEPPVPEHQFTPGSGAQPVGFGVGGRKQLDISLNFSQSWDSNQAVMVGTSGSNWEPASSFGGSLQLTRETRTNRTLLTYSGNGIAYVNRDPIWTTYQNLGFSQNFKVGRWGFTVADTFNYTPNSPYGGYGQALSGGASDHSVLNPQYVPNQSILTPTASSYFDSVLGQVEYGISRRSSWTVSGSYGFLRYPDSGFLNTNQVTASTGYNYSLSAKNSIFLTYTYSQFSYTDLNSHFVSHGGQFGFSHVLAGRLSLRASGGVEFINSSNLGESQKSAQFSGTGSLNYTRAHTNLSLSYFAGSTGGSGVLTGASTQDVQFRIGQELTRKWTGSTSLGYSHSGGLFQQQSYDTLFVSPGIRRAVTRNLGVNFNYTYQRQLTNSTCVTITCGTLSRNFLTVGIDYKFRPIPLE